MGMCAQGSAQGPAPSGVQLSFISIKSGCSAQKKKHGNITQTSALRIENQKIHSMHRLNLAGRPGLALMLELVCVLSVFQVPRARTRVWRRAVWLPGKERQVNAQRSQEVLPTDHVCAGLLPQSFHLVSPNIHVQIGFKRVSVPDFHSPSAAFLG